MIICFLCIFAMNYNLIIMKRLFLGILALGLVAIMNSCDFATLNNGVAEPPIDTVAMIAKINSFETQPIDRIVVFQVLEGREYSQEYRQIGRAHV